MPPRPLGSAVIAGTVLSDEDPDWFLDEPVYLACVLGANGRGCSLMPMGVISCK